MEIKEIKDFIEWEMKRIEKMYIEKDRNDLKMAMGFKLVEEMGELFEALLKTKGYQRKEKLQNFTQNREK